MASLKKCATWALDEARNGVGWILLFKIGRSWNVSTIYPDAFDWDSRTMRIGADELAEIRNAISVDENAILVNSYYHNLGAMEDITLAILENSLLWQYEDCHPLASAWDFCEVNDKSERR